MLNSLGEKIIGTSAKLRVFVVVGEALWLLVYLYFFVIRDVVANRQSA
jgi:hypothetical protein